jgi:hypothetical protein
MSELRRPNIDNYDMTNNSEQFFADYEAYQVAVKIEKFEQAIKEDYGIDDETWVNTPDKMKRIMADMFQESQNHAWVMEELETWRDNMPI